MAISAEDKTLLETTLSFAKKLLDANSTITQEINALNGLTLSDVDKAQLDDILRNGLDNVPAAKIPFLTSVVNGLEFVDKGYFNALLGLSGVNNNDTSAMKQTIATALSETYAFESNSHAFYYYKRLSMLAIATRDSAIIQDVIEKVQSLEVTQ